MNFVSYILYSKSHNRFYYGYSSSIISRIYWHNNSDKGFTKNFRPWIVIHVEFYQTKAEALSREKYFKTGKGRDWVKQHFVIDSGFISA